jgi:hypothetical protein
VCTWHVLGRSVEKGSSGGSSGQGSVRGRRGFAVVAVIGCSGGVGWRVAMSSDAVAVLVGGSPCLGNDGEAAGGMAMGRVLFYNSWSWICVVLVVLVYDVRAEKRMRELAEHGDIEGALGSCDLVASVHV